MRIFIDTCSLMSNSYGLLHNKLKHYLKNNNLKLSIVSSIFNELEKLKSKSNSSSGRAEHALNILTDYKKNNLLYIWNTYNKKFADPGLMGAVIEQRIKHEIIVITQDNKLSRDIIKINSLESQRGKVVSVFYISKNGDLVNFAKDFTTQNILSSIQEINSYTESSSKFHLNWLSNLLFAPGIKVITYPAYYAYRSIRSYFFMKGQK